MGVEALAYVVGEVADLAAWRSFAAEVLGAQLLDAGEDLVLRVDGRAVRVLLRPGGGSDGPVTAGWLVADGDAAHALAAQAGTPTRTGGADEAAARGVDGFVALDDPAGNHLELCWGPHDAATAFVGSRPHGGFRTEGLGLGHVVWSMPDIGPSMAFYRDLLGFRISDHASVPGRMFFFHVNPRHHSLALGQLGFEGLHHLMVEVLELDDLGRSYDAALDSSWPVITRLGRHSNDHVTSFYVRTPSHWAVEVGWGGLLITDEESWEVRELVEGPSLWGHERTWVSDEMKLRQGQLRRAAAEADLRAPLHLATGMAFDVDGRRAPVGKG